LTLLLLPGVVAAAQQSGLAATPNLDALQSIPTAAAITIRPRLFAAYGALLAAAMLGVLYLYRGRSFIVYWIGGWLLLAGSLAILSRGYSNPLLQNVCSGLSLLLAVWSAGVVALGALAFPDRALRWTWPVRLAEITAVWFLAGPFMVRMSLIVLSGAIATTGVLGWTSVRYLMLARRSRYAGAFLVGIGLGIIGVMNISGIAVVMYSASANSALGRVAVANVVTSIFVALGMHLLVFEDMTQELRRTNLDLAVANDEVKRLAITDPLTGCHNRRFFDEIERREMQRHRRYEAPLTVVFVDVDRFKQLNDTLGHDRGDDVLRAIGALLRRHVRESDYVIRWGGDEFLLLLACGEKEARAKASDLKLAAERAQEIAGLKLPGGLGLSIGVAAVSKQAETLSDAIRDADARMYRDKLAERASL
jgi:diguanylate cyclase (GGDEF)-like protein